jgi:hypothetical protein
MKGSEAGEHGSENGDFDMCGDSPHNYENQDAQWEVERAQSQNLGPHGMPVSDHILSEILPPPSSTSSQSSIHAPPISSRTKSWIQIQSPLASAPTVISHNAQNLTLPRVFTAFPRHIGSPDLVYLRSRDALTLPSESLQIALLKSYVEFVHPSLPILDLEEFLSAVKYGYSTEDKQRGRCVERENAAKKQIPFLLFQAVMFAGVAYVGMDLLRSAGYHNREAALRVFFSRVRVSPLLSCGILKLTY